MPRQVTPATMHTQITVQVQTATENTRGEIVPSWADLVTLYAEATPVRARDMFAAGKEQLPVDVIFRTRWRSGITAAHRVMWRAEPYAIYGEPVDVDGRRTTLELNCVRGVRDGR